MITALDPKRLISVVVFLFIVAFAIQWVCMSHPQITIDNILTLISKSLSLSVVMAGILGHHRVVDWLWRAVPLLNLVAPNLNGVFTLKNSSNWSMKQQRPDAVVATPVQNNAGEADQQPLVVMGTLTIKMGFFRLRITYIPSEQGTSRSSSEVLSAAIHVDRNSDYYQIHYVYKASVSLPSSNTDEQAFYGAAQLQLPKTASLPTRMNGHYWTNRAWNRGLNTAGIVEAVRER